MSLFSSKSEILNPQWIEIVFNGRNKNYGAYVLRKENAKSTVKAMIITVGLFASAIAAPTVINKIKGIVPPAAEKPVIVTTITIPTPPKPETPPPAAPAEPARPLKSMVQFLPPVVRPNVPDTENPPSIQELANADAGPVTVKGEEGGTVRIDEPVGNGERTGQMTDANNDIFVSVEKSAEYPDGMDKFYEYLGRNIRYPAMAREANVQGKVILTFVVEKDGSLTDIHVLRGIGSGCDEEAMRVVKASKKWKAGMQNGSKVRQQYTVPIAFTLAEN